MFGDCGHGLIMALFALYLVLNEKKLKNFKGGGEVSYLYKAFTHDIDHNLKNNKSFICYSRLIFTANSWWGPAFTPHTLLTTFNILYTQHSTHQLIFMKGGKPENP
jgi:vacuolar-type H+-ATPase subunit I/STV1